MASESEFTASETTTVDAPSAPRPSSAVTSSDSWRSWRASRSTTAPDGVTRTGFVLSSSTRPHDASRALSRWLIADGVTCNARAAASNVPWSTAAARAVS